MKRTGSVTSYGNAPCFFIFVLVTALIMHVRELNVNALCSVIFLALGGHHHFKEILFHFFVIRPNLTLAVTYGSDLA